MDGFVDFLGGFGQIPFEDEDDATDGQLYLRFPWIVAEDLNMDAVFHSLHPRKRNALLAAAELREVPSQKKKSERARGADTLALKTLADESERSKKAKARQDMVAKFGIGEARRRCHPIVEKKRGRTGNQTRRAKKRRQWRSRVKNRRTDCGQLALHIDEQVEELKKAVAAITGKKIAVEQDLHEPSSFAERRAFWKAADALPVQGLALQALSNRSEEQSKAL